MNNIEFIGLKDTPEDKYGMLGIVTVRVNVPMIIRYKMVAKKDGGLFYCPAAYTVTEGNEKSYESAFMIDSRMHEEQILSTIRENINKIKSRKAPSTSVFSDYPVKVQPKNANEDENLPF
jgi:hypothetical protein